MAIEGEAHKEVDTTVREERASYTTIDRESKTDDTNNVELVEKLVCQTEEQFEKAGIQKMEESESNSGIVHLSMYSPKLVSPPS
jgi:hypothetical protein